MSILKDLIFLVTFVMSIYFCISYLRLKFKQEKLIESFTDALLHDLKTPTLAQLRGLDVLQNGNLNSEQEELVMQIKESCKYTLDMISMILKTYRLESGRQILSLETFSLSELFIECFNEVLPQAAEKNLELVYEAADADTFVEADRADIKTVISHLLQNAVGYSDKNEKLFVSIDLKSNELKMEIKNKGTMYSPKYSAIGNNIMLHLSKKIIDSHHGTMFSEREACNINKFVFTLPLIHNNLAMI